MLEDSYLYYDTLIEKYKNVEGLSKYFGDDFYFPNIKTVFGLKKTMISEVSVNEYGEVLGHFVVIIINNIITSLDVILFNDKSLEAKKDYYDFVRFLINNKDIKKAKIKIYKTNKHILEHIKKIIYKQNIDIASIKEHDIYYEVNLTRLVV